jgi:hypothetical protein
MIGCGAEAVIQQEDPHLAWAQRIEHQIVLLALVLTGPKDDPDQRHLTYYSSAVVSPDDLDRIRPGLKRSVQRQVQGRPNSDRLPIAFLTYADGILVDVTTVTFSFNLDIPFPFPSGATLDDAVLQLLAVIALVS